MISEGYRVAHESMLTDVVGTEFPERALGTQGSDWDSGHSDK